MSLLVPRENSIIFACALAEFRGESFVFKLWDAARNVVYETNDYLYFRETELAYQLSSLQQFDFAFWGIEVGTTRFVSKIGAGHKPIGGTWDFTITAHPSTKSFWIEHF